MHPKVFKIASWNVNSIRSRLAHILTWLNDTQVDVLAIQESKVADAQFPLDAINEANYQAVYSGQKSYNGVALLYRGEAAECTTEVGGIDSDEKRILAATVSGIRVINLYVVNGSEVGAPRYRYKLQWLERMRDWIASELAQHPAVVVLGDFNIAPTNDDVHDPKKWAGRILCSDAERQALNGFFDLGLGDTFRLFQQTPEHTFSWWDYRQDGFNRNAGLRIDLLLASGVLCECCLSSTIDKRPRGWERPSDHAPLVAEFAWPS